MIDIHTHILPGIDDGSKDIMQTMQMIKEAELAGFTDIITTSHYIENEYDVGKVDRQSLIDAIQNEINKEEINIILHNGAEAFITNSLVDLVEDNEIPTLADSRYVLFELPMHMNVLYLDRVIEELITSKYRPIIAHPERYDIVKENPNMAIKWVKNGVLLQANYSSIIGNYGVDAKNTLLKLLDANAIHFLGTDTHTPNTKYIQINEMLEEYKKVIGEEKLEELTKLNPNKILNDEKIRPDEPEDIVTKKHWFR